MFPDLPAHHAATVDRALKGSRLVVRGMVLNAVLGLTKIAGGVLGNAYALVADGVESLSDIAISILIWAGFQWAARPPDEDHPYGHGKAEAAAGLVTALVVIGAGAGIGWHAVNEIRDPQRTPHWWTLVILAVVVATKVIFSRRLNVVGHDTESTALGVEASFLRRDHVRRGLRRHSDRGGRRPEICRRRRMGGACRVRGHRLQRDRHLQEGA
jgi:divalent metal cation (Fe/Co/Zn/Cd) transporter